MQFDGTETSPERTSPVDGKPKSRDGTGSRSFDEIRVVGDPNGVGVVLGFKDDAWPPLSLVGSVFDGVVCGDLLCALSSGKC